MKKRLFAILTLSLFMVSWSFSLPIHADTLALPQNYLPGLYDMGYGLADGAVIDITGFNSAIGFMDTYSDKRIKDPFLEMMGNFYEGLTYDDAFGPSSYYNYNIPSIYGIPEDEARLLDLQYNNYLIDGTPVLSTFNLNNLAFWNRFNSQYLTKYLYDLAPSEVINFPAIYDTVNLGSVKFGNNNISFSSLGYGTFSAYINGFTYSNLHYPFAVRVLDGQNYYYYIVGDSISPGTNNVYSSNGYWSGVTDPSYFPDFALFEYPYFTDISDAITFSMTGTIQSDDQLANAPDVIFGDNGEIIGQDVIIPADPTQDLFFDLTKFWDLIQDAINDPDKDVITFDDLVDGGVIVKGDGTTADDTDVKDEPLTKVLDDAIADEDTDLDDNPTGDNSIVPPLPPLIQFKPYGDKGDPTKAFDGTSVLARIINVTNKSLPEDLMLVFWGIVFGMITLGIIKILHK